MYNSLKAKWNEQPSLAANQHFPKFRYYLERGGKVALTYIEENSDLVETVLGGPDEVRALKNAIAKKNTAHENQVYFVREAKRLESQIKAVFRAKYNALQGYCEQESLPWEELTPETLLPATRRAVETGEWDIAETAAEAAGEDTPPKTQGENGNEVSVELIDGNFISIVSNPDGTRTAFGEDNGEKVPLAAGEYRSARHIYTVGEAGEVSETEVVEPEKGEDDQTKTGSEGTEVEAAAEGEEVPPTETEASPEATTKAEEEETPADDKSAADELRAKIASLNQDGLNKTEIWAEVKPAAEAVGWSRTAVWAYVDELAE